MPLLLLFPLLIAVALYIAYSRSSAAAARRQTRSAVAVPETLHREIQTQDRLLREMLSQAATTYVQDIRVRRLQAIPVDELRRQAFGLRLQALKEAGLLTLADLQGWSGNRLTQLRGVGPKSAATIAYVAGVLISQSNALPVHYPLPASAQGPGKPLLQAIYLLRWSQSWLPEKHKQLLSLLRDFRARQTRVLSRTGFIRWLWGFGSHPDIQAATTEAEALARELQGQNTAAQLRSELSGLLATVRTLQSNGVDWELLEKDSAANQDDYTRMLGEQLGPPGTVMPPAAAGAVEPVAVRAAVPPPVPAIYVPKPPASPSPPPRMQSSSAVWVVPGKDISVAGFVIRGGMVYVGSGLPSVCGGGREPALIDPSLSVLASAADCHTRKTNYWPSYETVTSEARASYLQWLATGKSDPQADIGYVFLYFYGLERRAIADSLHEPEAKADLPVIEQEIRRLLEIYGNNGSFCSYANSLLDYLTARNVQGLSLENLPIPRRTNRWELSLELRVGLGLHSQAGRPLPAEWALAWYLSAPELRRGITVTRCPDPFAALFNLEFEKRLGAGLKLPANKTRIKVSHRPASLSFAGQHFTADLDLPDVSVLSGPVARLQEIGDACSELLAPYSRYVGANPDRGQSREALLLLPVSIWPDAVYKPLRELRDNIANGDRARLMRLRDVTAMLPLGEEFNKVRFGALARALGSMGLGIEPDVRMAGSIPGNDDPVVLFAADGLGHDESPCEEFISAAFMLQLSALVASADGNFEDSEAKVMLDFINSGLKISDAERQRLMARVYLYRTSPPNSAGVRKRIATLDQAARQAISALLLQIALADGVVDSGKVKVLENLFGLLGLDQRSLYSKLHELEAQSSSVHPAIIASAPTAIRTGKKPSAAVRLDASKLAALKADSARVSALLEDVFAEPVPAEPPESAPKEQGEPASTLLDLDAEHAGLLHVLLQRAQWSREELEEVCADRNLMVDGAIERINEAAFARFDQALMEGEDPVDINCQLIMEERTA